MKLTIDRLGHHGDGIAHAPGGEPVFVPVTLPGEQVEATLDGTRATDVRVLTPSPDRVAPPCRHFRSCGGCAVQHASDSFVEGWKAGIVRQALAAQGLEAPIRAVHTSPPQSRRRATLSGKRTKSGAIVGFHGRASGTVIEIPGCQLLRPEIVAAIPVLEEVTRLGASRKGELDLTVTLTDDGLDLAVMNAKDADAPLAAEITGVAAETFPRISWNGALLAQEHPLTLDLHPVRVPVPPGAFLQATEHGQAVLTAAVRDAVGTAGRIADLFSGLGTFALPLAANAAVHAVEGEAALLAALDKGWREAKGLHKVTTERRDLFRRPLEADELNRFDAIVLDPPRAGAEAQAAALARSDVKVIAHVSCNPATFAREAKTLAAAGFSIDWIEVVDQFRWSAHVELAARLSRP